MTDLQENNRFWWEQQVRRLELSVKAAERDGDEFLARGERGALDDAIEKLSLCIV